MLQTGHKDCTSGDHLIHRYLPKSQRHTAFLTAKEQARYPGYTGSQPLIFLTRKTVKWETNGNQSRHQGTDEDRRKPTIWVELRIFFCYIRYHLCSPASQWYSSSDTPIPLPTPSASPRQQTSPPFPHSSGRAFRVLQLRFRTSLSEGYSSLD